ncbi:hypothetical protein JFY56_02880 [Pseudomonas sp. Milli4]|uniref:Toxin-antitoxin system HicB family antitoxin n=2 Tax=Pseudomonas schmalbachii TaxID=2816993 RepID=A0ABS3TKK2_9PSED|nr:hypothetical protein [Pseudomonas schmalbachii]
MRDQVDAIAAAGHMSMNAFIVQAIEEKLAGGTRQRLLLDALERALNAQEPI